MRIFLIILLLISFNVNAEKNTPKGLTFSHKHKLLSHNTYKGELEINVSYVVRYEGSYLKVGLYPDEKSKNLLPKMKLRKGDGVLNETLIPKDGEDDVLFFIEPDQAYTLYKNEKSITGTATVLITEYTNGFECDSPFYMVTIKNVTNVKQNPGFAEGKYLDYGC